MASRLRTGTVCVLGGTGFVGRTLIGQLVRRGYSVRVPTRSRQRHRRLLVLPGVYLTEADVHDERALKQLVRGSDAVVNLIGILNEKGHDGSGFKAVHVDLVQKLVRACQETGVDRLLHMSALKANAERGPSHYLRTRGQAEQLIKGLAGEDLKYTLFRPSTIFGPEDSFINRFVKLLRVLPVLPLARADARFAPVYVDDVVQAYLTALEDPATHNQTYQLCGPNVYTLGEIIDLIRQWTGIRRPVLHLPDGLGRLQALTADYLIPGKPFSLDNFLSLTVANVCTENGLEALGIKPRSMAAIVPTYLRPRRGEDRMSRFRQTAGR